MRDFKFFYLSIVVPVFNEEKSVEVFFEAISEELKNSTFKVELIFINDGSEDDTWETLLRLRHPKIDLRLINLSRNFGKESATTAGLRHAIGDAVIIMDVDLQDPPSCIHSMVDYWRIGFDVVNMERQDRSSDGVLKKYSALLYYRFLRLIADHPIQVDVGDFRLISKKALLAILELTDRSKYMKGLLNWPGFRQITLQYSRPPRLIGESKWRLSSLFNLALTGIVSFSTKPLRFAFLICWLSSFIALISAPSLIMSAPPEVGLFVLAGVFIITTLLISVGCIAEYINMILTETKARPEYFIMDKIDHLSSECKGNREKDHVA